MGSGNAQGCIRNAKNCFGFQFLQRYHKDGNEFLNHILRVTGDETWVSFVNVETKEQSAVKAVDARTFTKQDENFKQTMPIYQKADGNCFMEQERSDGGIHVTRNHNKVRSILRNTVSV
jgi:hypothetical protein